MKPFRDRRTDERGAPCNHTFSKCWRACTQLDFDHRGHRAIAHNVRLLLMDLLHNSVLVEAVALQPARIARNVIAAASAAATSTADSTAAAVATKRTARLPALAATKALDLFSSSSISSLLRPSVSASAIIRLSTLVNS